MSFIPSPESVRADLERLRRIQPRLDRVTDPLARDAYTAIAERIQRFGVALDDEVRRFARGEFIPPRGHDWPTAARDFHEQAEQLLQKLPD